MILNSDEIVAAVANRSKYFKKDVEEILKSYYKIIEISLKTGVAVRVPNIGVYKLHEVPAKPEREHYIPLSGKKELLPAREAFNKPNFTFSKTLIEKIQEKTLGNTF